MNAVDDTVTAPEVSSYLASKGWHRDGELRGASIWRLDSKVRLLVPDLHQYDDAEELVLDAIRKIARYEHRPEADVRRDIAEPTIDAQYFRTHPDAPSGLIPLPLGVRVVQNVLYLIKAAASAVEQGPGLRYEWKQDRSSRVDTLLRNVLLGTGPPGSYVLTARVPAEPISAQQPVSVRQPSLFEPEELSGPGEADKARPRVAEVSGRTVMAQMHTALQSARGAAVQVIEEQSRFDAFYAAVEHGVSANLCRALSEFGGDGKRQPFEIGFSWARGVRRQPPGGPAEVPFTSAMPRVLAKAADELTAMAHAGEAQISGAVIELHHEAYEQPRILVRGELRMPGRQSRGWRSLWVVVTPADYDAAFEAQRRQREIEVSGRLTTSRRRLELVAATFRALPQSAGG